MKVHPGTFGLAGAGYRSGATADRRFRARYKAPYAFTGGTIRQVVVDVSGKPYEDVEKELALAFAKD